MTTPIPLDQLHATYLNVRKTGGASIDALAASIAAHGLLHNLVVARNADGYAVVAGGRRLKALQALQQAGTLPAALADGIPCHVVDDAQAREASLAENIIRQAMHPADEFDAIMQLVADGLTTAEISARFGQTERWVAQRMRLANVAPDVLADYRAGKATLEQMTTLALTDDQALQQRLWSAGERSHWKREPNHLRQQITAQETNASSKLGKFVGLAAYEKAGGAVRRDLFGEDVYLQDAELLEQLAQDKLERTAEKIRKEGWSWVDARTEFSYGEQYAFGHVPCHYKGKKKTWPVDAMAHAGVVVSIGYGGEMEVERGLVRPEDRKALAKATGSEVEGGKVKPERHPGELSFAAVQRLQAEATGILQADVAALPRIALALLAAELACGAFYDYSDYGTAQRQWVHIHREQSGRMPGNLRNVIPQTPAGQRFAETEKAWKERLPKKKADLREWVLAQEFETIAKLLAFLAARELDLVDIAADAKQGVVDAAAAAQVDLSQHWTPTEEWLATLPKAVVIAMVTDAAGATAAAPLAKLKKDQLPHAAIDLLPKGWLPKPLRPRAPAKLKKASRKHAAAEADDS